VDGVPSAPGVQQCQLPLVELGGHEFERYGSCGRSLGIGCVGSGRCARFGGFPHLAIVSHCPWPLGDDQHPGLCPVALGTSPVALGSSPVALGSSPVALGSSPVALGTCPVPLDTGRCLGRCRPRDE